jgi:hypothetical protein
MQTKNLLSEASSFSPKPVVSWSAIEENLKYFMLDLTELYNFPSLGLPLSNSSEATLSRN